MSKENIYKIGYISALNFSLLTFLLIVLSIFRIIDTDIFLSYNILFTILISSLTLTVFYKHNLDKSRMQYIPFVGSIFQTAPYFFISILIILAVNQFLKIDFILQRNFHLTVLAIAFGFLAFYKNRDKIEKELEDEKQIEEQKEQQRAQDFAYKFPRISRIWGIRSIVKWMYKEGWGYSLSLLIIAGVGFLLRIWNISNLSLWQDESLSVLVAKQITRTAFPLFLSGDFYLRALPYHYFLSFFLGLSENINLLSRMANIPFFILTCFLIYLISKKIIGSKIVGIISIILYSLSSFSISMFREARFYEFYLSFYILFIYLLLAIFLHILKNGNGFIQSISNIWKRFKIQIASLIILGFVLISTSWSFAYILYSTFFCGMVFGFLDKKNSKLWVFISVASLILFTIGLIIYNDGALSISDYLTQNSVEWKSNLSLRPFGDFSDFIQNKDIYFFILIFTLGVISIMSNKRHLINGSMLLISILLPPYLFLENQGFGIYAPRYFYNYFVPLLLIGAIVFYDLFLLLRPKLKKIFIFGLAIIFLAPLVVNSFNESASIGNLNSIVGIKNNNLDDMFKQVLAEYGSEYLIFADSHTAVPFYIYSNRLPDGMLFEDKRIATKNNLTDQFLNVSYFSAKNITNQNKKAIFLMWHSPGNLDSEVVNLFDNQGKLVYRQGAKRIYLLKSNS